MPAPTTAVVVAEPKPIALIKEELEKRIPDLLTVLPPGMDAKRFARVSLLAISKNKDLLKCTPSSIIRSIIEAAEIGLEPTGSLNRAWLVPYGDEAQLMIGYQGYADLMRDTGRVTRIVAEVVFEGDHFKVVKGTEKPRIEHEPAYATEDPTKITYAYVVVWFTDGGIQSEVMTRQQIEGIRAKSKQKNGPTWTQNWPQMARKTLIRRIANYVPLSTKAIEAIARDDEREFGPNATATIASTRASAVREKLAARKAPSSPPEAQGAPEGPSVPSESADGQDDAAEGQPEVCGSTGPSGETCAGDPGHEPPCAPADGSVTWTKG